MKYRLETNNPFHLASFSHLAHILSLLFFSPSVLFLLLLLILLAPSFFLCGKFNGFLGSEWDILSQWTIITRVRATSCNSLTPSPTGYNGVFCLCIYSACVCVSHLKSAWSVKTRYCTSVKASGWPPHLLPSKSAYSVLKNNRQTTAYTYTHLCKEMEKSLKRGMDLLLLSVQTKIRGLSNQS